MAWISAERAMAAADEADDPLVLASAARAATHALLAVGRFEDALNLGETAARWLAPQVAAGDPEALSLFGMLHLRTAVGAARHQDRPKSVELLALAARAADQLGEDGNYWQTGFGPTNVELHRLAAGLDLGADALELLLTAEDVAPQLVRHIRRAGTGTRLGGRRHTHADSRLSSRRPRRTPSQSSRSASPTARH